MEYKTCKNHSMDWEKAKIIEVEHWKHIYEET